METIKREVISDKSGYDSILINERWHIERVVDLKDAIIYLKSLPGIGGAMVVGDEGLVVESKFNPHFKSDLVAAIATNIIRCVKEGLRDIGFDECDQIMVETLNQVMWIIQFKEQAFVLCGSPDINLGALKVRVEELLEHLSQNIR